MFFCVFLCFCVVVVLKGYIDWYIKIKRKRCFKLLSVRLEVAGMVYIVSMTSPNNAWMIILVSSGLSQ